MKFAKELLEKIIGDHQWDDAHYRQLLNGLGLEVESISRDEFSDLTKIEIETLAHRGDHLSVLGCAREIFARYAQKSSSAITVQQIRLADDTFTSSSFEHQPKILTEFCTQYSLAEISFSEPGFTPHEDAFSFLLDSAQDQPPIVRLTNYVRHEIGQPLHAFAADKVTGEIRIVLSNQTENINALDGKEYEVPEGSLLIRDAEKIIAVAGVIGCSNTACDQQTKHVLLESANFDPKKVRKTARAMGLSTDASYAFERGVDPHSMLTAIRRVLALLPDYQVLNFYSGGKSPEPHRFVVPLASFRQQTAQAELSSKDVTEVLECLGYETLSATDEDLEVQVPSWRYWNVLSPMTVLEDYCRIVGYNEIKTIVPSAVPASAQSRRIRLTLQEMSRIIDDVLSGAGFNEIISRSYYSNEERALVAALSPDLEEQHISIANSIDGAYSNLKVTNALHSAEIVSANLRNGVEQIKFYELARIFKKDPATSAVNRYEENILSFAAASRWDDNAWQKPPSTETLLRKTIGLFDALLDRLGLQAERDNSQLSDLLHPGRQLKYSTATANLGGIGTLHPKILKNSNLKKTDVIYGQFNLDTILAAINQQKGQSASDGNYSIVDFPTVKWELTFMVSPDYSANYVTKSIRQINPKYLVACDLLDSFKKPEEDYSRVSVRMLFQSNQATLSNEVVDTVVDQLRADLSEEYGLNIVS